MKRAKIKNLTPKIKDKITDKTRFWGPAPTVLFTAAIFLLSQVFAGIIIVLIPTLLGWDEAKTNVWLDTPGVNFGLIILVEFFVLLMVYKLLKIKNATFDDIGLAWPRIKDVFYAVAGFGIYFVLYIALAAAIKAIIPSVDFDQQQQLGFDTHQAGFSLVLIFVALVIAAPVTEEILARGFLYTGLKTKLPRWGAAVITSTMFAVAHLQFGSGQSLVWVAAIDTFVLSLVLIFLREKTGYLGAPILLHMLKNSLAFVLLFVIKAV